MWRIPNHWPLLSPENEVHGKPRLCEAPILADLDQGLRLENDAGTFRCHECKQPLVEIDNRGIPLTGCITVLGVGQKQNQKGVGVGIYPWTRHYTPPA
jgi:hypothetical protein